MSITVCIPVGPKPHHQQWLDECLQSVAAQTLQSDEILLVDDMANLDEEAIRHILGRTNYRIWKSPWNLGVAHAFNCGVGLAQNEAVFLLGADDTLDPKCLQRSYAAYQHSEHKDSTYFYVGVKYMDTGEKQFLPCGAALVTKQLWQRSGGFPTETALGASDAALISIMMVHPDAGTFTCVDASHTLYNYRRHSNTDTAEKITKYSGAILNVRDVLTRTWQPPNWNRYN